VLCAEIGLARVAGPIPMLMAQVEAGNRATA